MKSPRFFINSKDISGKEVILDDKNLINQIKKVLRLRSGDEIILLDNSGKEYITAIKEIGNSAIEAEIIESRQNQNEPELKITLYQSLCKKDKFEWILQKGTEIGISEFIPVISERTEKLNFDRGRAEKILKEAAEQSERGIIPKLSEMRYFEETIKNAAGEKIILDKSGELIGRQVSRQKRGSPKAAGIKHHELSIFVGPEGGWTEQELQAAKENGARIVSLGPRVLRTETAGLAAAAILLQ